MEALKSLVTLAKAGNLTSGKVVSLQNWCSPVLTIQNRHPILESRAKGLELTCGGGWLPGRIPRALRASSFVFPSGTLSICTLQYQEYSGAS